MFEIIMGLILTECLNTLLGLAVYGVREIEDKLSEYEEKNKVWIILGGLIYWILKFISYPILIPYRKTKKKREKIKEYQEKLIRKIDNNYLYNYKSILNIRNKIKELNKSLNQDLYSRASDSYNDLLHILIKCSDGEGNIDINEFENIIEDALNECHEVVEVAYNEHVDRLNKAKQQYYNNKKDEIKQDIENMKNKNKDFKTMWKENK